MPSNHHILCLHLLLLPSIFPSIRGFSNRSVLCIRWPKYWSSSFSIRPSSEYSGLISLQFKGLSKIFCNTTVQKHRCSAFFIDQLSHPYMTTEKTTALTRQNFLGKVMSLLFNMLSRLVITFLPRSKHLLISWLQSPPAVIFSSVQLLSHVWFFATPWTTARQASLSIINSRSPLKPMSIE